MIPQNYPVAKQNVPHLSHFIRLIITTPMIVPCQYKTNRRKKQLADLLSADEREPPPDLSIDPTDLPHRGPDPARPHFVLRDDGPIPDSPEICQRRHGDQFPDHRTELCY